MNTELNKEEQKQTMKSVLDGYVKHKNGAIFQVLKHNKDIGKCFLRSKNKYREMSVIDIKQGLVNGTWLSINEHEWKKWVKEDNAYIKTLTDKLVKRIIISQLLIEVNDSLIDDNEDNKYLKNVLLKSNKQLEKIVDNNYDRMYSVDNEILQNLINQTEEITTKLSSLNIEDYPYINKMLDSYKDNPEVYQMEPLELTKLNS